MSAQPTFSKATEPLGVDLPSALADLLTYGLVGLSTPGAARDPLPDATWWCVATNTDGPGFHQVSPRLREVAVSLTTPVADARLLGAMVALRAATGSHVLHLPLPDTAGRGRRHLTRRGAAAVASRALMLREHRRQLLGLSARLDPGQIDNAIYSAFFAPVAEAALGAALGPKKQVRIAAQVPDTQCPKAIAPLTLRGDDPVSDNVFALAMRLGFHGAKASLFKPLVRLSPGHFGLQVRRSAAPSLAMQRIALSVPQIHLLSSLNAKGWRNV
ncbi:hypothetical protein GGQ68_001025 [Sagittula marina]|uniref:Uncharacterized protein n=1 Tax=Sagittula marina TaxID=943940 RepID=A0A7W6GT16_9RHOB|nr:hypothetical protein [Sagittula marina]MBB3984709.1 hypothetical protein [Sagittula marina]